MSTQIPSKTETALATKGTLRWFLEDQESPYTNRLKKLLGDRMPHFCASLINLSHSQAAFNSVRPSSVITAGIIAATLDLPVDRNLGFAWIIPYGELAQFQIGYKGYIQLALRSGRYAGMNAVPVNSEALGGYDAIGDPIINWEAIDETKEAIGYAFAWKLTTGFTKIVYWPKSKVEAHARKYSQAYAKQKKDSPWFTQFDAMALKTVVKASLTKWGIMSVEDRMQVALERDQSAAIDVDATPIYPDNDQPAVEDETATPAATENLSDLTDKLNQQNGSAAPAVEPEQTAEAEPQQTPAAEPAQQTPLTLVPDAEPAPPMPIEEIKARLAAAQYVSDVRALRILWTGPKAVRTDSERTTINDLCDQRINEIKSAGTAPKG